MPLVRRWDAVDGSGAPAARMARGTARERLKSASSEMVRQLQPITNRPAFGSLLNLGSALRQLTYVTFR